MKIKIQNLIFTYFKSSDFSLQIDDLQYLFERPLAIYGLSGSGKTTLGKIMSGIIRNYDGTAKYDSDKLKIIYTSQIVENILTGLTVSKLLEYFFPDTEERENFKVKLNSYLELFSIKLVEIYDKHGYELSSGELRKFALSLALAHQPDLLILDEPTVGLDLKSRKKFIEIMQNYSGQRIIVSQDFDILEKLCLQIWILDQGKMVFDGNFSELQKNCKLQHVIGLNVYSDLKRKRKEIFDSLITH